VCTGAEWVRVRLRVQVQVQVRHMVVAELFLCRCLLL
jgi:hypothetical protein